MAKINKNEKPLRSVGEISEEICWDEYEYSHLFEHYCTLYPNFKIEKIEIKVIHDESLTKREGLVYALVVENKIVKIGQSINTFKKRLGSYNTGKQSYRSRGTNSGANFFILQSLLNINKPIEVYLLTPDHKRWEILDVSGTEAFPSAKIWERVLLDKFKKTYGRLPIGDSQN